MTPVRLTPEDDPAPVLALIKSAFAYMEARIDPPSSMNRLTEDDVRRQAADGEVWIIGTPDAPEACVFLTREPDTLYVGKLAVSERQRRRGHARLLMAQAEIRARTLGYVLITLQSRIELTENHATFRHLGYTKTRATAHPGYKRPTSLTFEKQLT